MVSPITYTLFCCKRYNLTENIALTNTFNSMFESYQVQIHGGMLITWQKLETATNVRKLFIYEFMHVQPTCTSGLEISTNTVANATSFFPLAT